MIRHHVPMSSIDACLAGIDLLNERILEQPETERHRHVRERSIGIEVPDLATVFHMRLTVDGLTDITHHPTDRSAPRPQVRITVTSDDLVAIAEKRLSAKTSLLTRRVKVEAGVSDMLRMRKLL